MNLFNPADNSLTRQTQSMVYQRWYATVVTTDKAEQVVMGGRTDKSWGTHVPPIKVSYADIPEVYSNGSWRTLTTAQSEKAYGATDDAWNWQASGAAETTGSLLQPAVRKAPTSHAASR